MNLIDIYRIFVQMPKDTHHILSSPGNLSTEYILGHKVSLKKYKKIEATTSILSDHSERKLVINIKKNSRKYTISQRLKNTIK